MVEEYGHQIITVERTENTPKSRTFLLSTSDGEGIAESKTDKVVQDNGSNTKGNQHQIVRGEHNNMKLIVTSRPNIMNLNNKIKKQCINIIY